MSLDWNVTKIKDYFEVTRFASNKKDKKEEIGWLRPITDALIWATMSVDMGEITEKTIDEFWWRLQFMLKIRKMPHFTSFPDVEKKYGINISPWEFTYQDLVDHIGLSTNVHTKTRRQWMARMNQAMVRDCDSFAKDKYPVYESKVEDFKKARKESIRLWEKYKRKEDKEERIKEEQKAIEKSSEKVDS